MVFQGVNEQKMGGKRKKVWIFFEKCEKRCIFVAKFVRSVWTNNFGTYWLIEKLYALSCWLKPEKFQSLKQEA